MTKQTLSQFLFSPNGRIPRYLYWKFYLLLSLLLFVLNVALLTFFGPFIVRNWPWSLWLAYLPFSYPFIIVRALLLFIPYIDILIFLALGIIKGTQGDNQYGPDPFQNQKSDVDTKEDTKISNLPPSNSTPSPIKSSFSPLDKARKK